jgi:alkylation response protein AidB-like acyl-CoA dehydrogenase
MDFEFTEEQGLLRETIQKFIEKECPREYQRELDEKEEFPHDLWNTLAELGMFGLIIDEQYGGMGGNVVDMVVVVEELAKGMFVLGDTFMQFNCFGPTTINFFGSEEQKSEYLPKLARGEIKICLGVTENHSGTDALGIKSSAVKEGSNYRINGSKIFITNAPIADYFVIIVRTSEEESKIKGGTWFILERGMEGLSTGLPLDKLGMRSSPTGQIFMEDVVVSQDQILGEEGKGFYYLMESLDVERVMEGASTVGIAQACLDASVTYANERYTFGKPIAEHQMIKEMIAEMAIGIELSRNYLYTLCRAADRGEKITKQAAMIKLYSSRVASKAAKDAVQIMGGYGYMEEYKVARYFRDAKHHEIGAGTTEIMKLIIAREVMRESG